MEKCRDGGGEGVLVFQERWIQGNTRYDDRAGLCMICIDM